MKSNSIISCKQGRNLTNLLLNSNFGENSYRIACTEIDCNIFSSDFNATFGPGGGMGLSYVMILGFAIILGTFLGYSWISGYLFGLFPDFGVSFFMKFAF